MRNVVLALIAVIGLSVSHTAPAVAKTFKLNSKRLIEVIDVVDGSAIDLAQQLHKMAAASKDPIDILINSPGGAIVPGYMFVDAMDAARSQGIKIRCAVGMLAASMAFNMLAHCDERVALRHAALLFHPPRISSRQPMLVPDLLQAAEDLQRIIDASTGELIDMVGMRRAQFYKHFNQETLWAASDLAKASGKPWLRIVDNITGSDKVFTHEKPKMFLFFRASSTYEIIHVSPINRTQLDQRAAKAKTK